jgi:iron(III) transport system permease protein
MLPRQTPTDLVFLAAAAMNCQNLIVFQLLCEAGSPTGIRTTIALLQQIDKSMEEASASLGASDLRTFRRVMLPLILPAFFAGLGVVFIRSMTAISATIFLVSIDWTLITVKILENMTEVALGPAAAFSVFVILVVLIVTELLNFMLGYLTSPSLRVSRVGT